MANFIKPYNDDPFVGHLATPITSSAVTRALLQNLPAYRFGLTPLLRGLEIGLAHGYFLIGPFVKLGPLRDSDVALFAGFLSTIGLKMADILYQLGYVEKGHLLTVTRDDLVGQYIGHTAPKTKEVLKKAMGGVLFIDEAYYLYKPDNERDYGSEAIEILLQVMEINVMS